MEHPITSCSLNLTRACNLNCSYCFTNGCTQGSLSLATGRQAVDFLCSQAVKYKQPKINISYWGGEPLLEWELMKELTLYAESAAKENAITVTFGGTTNGTLLTPDKLDFLEEHKVLFMVSLDGTAKTHNRYRGQHALIVENVKHALKRWPFLRVRTSPFPERIDHFFEDIKYLIDLGIQSIMFSPVYEGGWTEDHWNTWEQECYKVVDLMASIRKGGGKIEIEHFRSYCRKDNSKWPCGAGRFYVGIDIDGSIYPCHRFNKFNDTRDWRDKEACIGHIAHGITRPEFRDKFIDFKPQCGTCGRLDDTPCHGGCYAINYDFTGDITQPHIGICRYVEMQKKVSTYYHKKAALKQITPQQVLDRLREMEERLAKLEVLHFGEAINQSMEDAQLR